MKRQCIAFRFRLAAAACALAAAGSASVAGESSPQGSGVASSSRPVATWKALAASGRVEARPAEAGDGTAWLPLVRGDELAPLTLVQTGTRGRATLAQGGNLLIVDPDSRVELPEAGYGGMRTSVMQPSGSVLYEVEGRKNPHFEVVTPREMLAARLSEKFKLPWTFPGSSERFMNARPESVRFWRSNHPARAVASSAQRQTGSMS